MLEVWENGLRQDPVCRALGLLKVVYPERSAESLGELSIGERDARLFEARQLLFGPRITSTAPCPRCSERLEWESEVADLCADPTIGPSSTGLSVAVDGCRFRLRLPNSNDLSAVLSQQDAVARHTRLLERCLLEATTSTGESLPREQFPEGAFQSMVQEMERAAPQSQLEMDLTCPACGHRWQALFDIVSFLWAEINNWAERTLRAVHLLARAYGWREADILAMSATRRQIYLEMANQ